jgi:hypothetical protein
MLGRRRGFQRFLQRGYLLVQVLQPTVSTHMGGRRDMHTSVLARILLDIWSALEQLEEVALTRGATHSRALRPGRCCVRRSAMGRGYETSGPYAHAPS